MRNLEKYEAIIKSRTKVLFIQGRPGTAKSSIIKAIAKKNNWKMYDIRLNMYDSSEIIGFPRPVKTDDNGDVMVYAIPHWAYEANKSPSIVFFDELNKADMPTLKASLQIFLDHQIGHQFFFNDNVYFAAAGNMGDADSCDVEELDSAIKERLYMINHELTVDEWVDEFAKDNVIPQIINFIKSKPDYFYPPVKEGSNSNATPRSWTQLSDFLKDYLKKDINDIDQVIEVTGNFGLGFVGVQANTAFLNFLKIQKSITITDILNNFNQVKEDLKKIGRDQVSELINSLKSTKFDKFTIEQIDNLSEFLKTIHPDERISYISTVVTDNVEYDPNTKKAKLTKKLEKLFSTFKEDILLLEETEKRGDKKQ